MATKRPANSEWRKNERRNAKSDNRAAPRHHAILMLRGQPILAALWDT